MHRAAFAAHQAVVLLHQLAQHLLDRHAARQSVRVPTIGAERQISLDHRFGETGGDGFLTERQMAGALHQVLQEQVEGALLGVAQAHLRPVQGQTLFLADIVVQTGTGRPRRPIFCCRHELSSKGRNQRDGLSMILVRNRFPWRRIWLGTGLGIMRSARNLAPMNARLQLPRIGISYDPGTGIPASFQDHEIIPE